MADIRSVDYSSYKVKEAFRGMISLLFLWMLDYNLPTFATFRF